MSGFASAGQAEILRAAQKDEVFSDRLQKAWMEILLKVGGTRLWMKLKHINVGHFVYGAVTTLSGLQTLGEEYTGIVQVDNTKNAVPRFIDARKVVSTSMFLNTTSIHCFIVKFEAISSVCNRQHVQRRTVLNDAPIKDMRRRLILIIFDSFGSVIILSILSQIENYFRNNPFIRPEAKSDLLNCISVLRNIIPFIERIHRANFYAFGMFYHLSKRFTRIQYVLVWRWLKDFQSLNGFRLLGFVTFIHLLAVAINSMWSWFTTPPEEGNITYEPPKVSLLKVKDRKCTLCLDERRNVSTTPCGHLFCWICIMDWLQTQNQCPLCRERVEPSRVVPLQNYL